MNEVVVGIDGLDYFQPSRVESEGWLMPAPATYVTPVYRPTGKTSAYRHASQMQAPLPTFLPRMGLMVR